MARRRAAEKREPKTDARYQSKMVACLISSIMRCGKRSTAERIVYGAFDQIEKQLNEEPLKVFETALDNVKPRLEVKSRRVGGATYQVPIEVSWERQVTLALRWIIQYSKARKGMGMSRSLAIELMDSYKNQGSAVKKREDTYKMAQANKAFAHYRW